MEGTTSLIEKTGKADVLWGAKEAPVNAPLMRGIHHLAFNTDDLRATLDFYCRVLGMPIVKIITTATSGDKDPAEAGNPKFRGILHVFLNMGNDSLLAFFVFPKGQAAKADRDAVGGMQHCSFVCSPSRFREMQERLARNNVKIVYGPGLVSPPNLQSIYFYDPNGIRLEFCANLDFVDDEKNDPGVVRYMPVERDKIRRKLEGATNDSAWIDSILENLSSEA